MKDLKDYLHLYLGCECVSFNMKGVLTAKLIADKKVTKSKIKPILRRLNDMTEEEMKELYKLVFNKEFGRNGDIRFYDSLSKDSKPNDISRWVLWSGVERLGIKFDGEIWADSDLSKYKYNQHEVTRWLLSKHFDIFGLIESELAIDKSTLK